MLKDMLDGLNVIYLATNSYDQHDIAQGQFFYVLKNFVDEVSICGEFNGQCVNHHQSLLEQLGFKVKRLTDYIFPTAQQLAEGKPIEAFMDDPLKMLGKLFSSMVDDKSRIIF